ncbi:hypothetical protein L873DRAFT_1688773 [Choiromyces venosus 120613-1]|uniref:UV radiation resistance-associated gene protein n=1 Tax=Choiromyces venosus 120613-1 TaxID=1336337 RepID=A0A3N4JIT2_9PEZI|nr:hypothetical protein L873DRAFT_1688773 [Choiromyces venosus 120613-1]
MPSDSDGLRTPDVDFVPGIETMSRERPLLLPSGRKLRHLTGIALRNFTTSVQKAQSHRSTRSSDDDVLAGAWKSAAAGKLPARVEEGSGGGGVLVPAKSEVDLTRVDVDGDVDVGSGVAGVAGGGGGAGLRRRSTRGNPLGLESPMTRQKRLEDVAAGRMADVFFSLHVGGGSEEDSIYISEVVSKSMNPNFQSFELSHSGPHISRLDKVIVKIWAGTQEQFRLIVELNIALSALQFIGKNLENFRHPFPSNSIIFFLSDGIYTTFMDMPLSTSALHRELPIRGHAPSASIYSITPASDNLIPTASYDSIMKLNNLEACIQDAAQTSAKVAQQINQILSRESPAMTLLRSVSQERESRKTLQAYLTSEQKRLRAAKARRASLQRSLTVRREAIASGREAQTIGEKYLKEAAIGLDRCRRDLAETRRAIVHQRSRIVEDLQSIYPIEPIPHHPLSFTILSHPLSNTPQTHEDSDPDVLAAALGYVAHVTYLLSFYLGIALRYPLMPVNSGSFVRDPISVIAGARTFPLWPRGSVYFRFEYAVFLLNKDVEQLMCAQGLWVMDIRHTLANLKYLLLFVGAGGTAGTTGRSAGEAL